MADKYNEIGTPKRQFDFPWVLAGIMAIALLLITPRLSADNSGRITTTILLVAMLSLFLYGLSERVHFRKPIFWILTVLSLAVCVWFGHFVWPHTLEASPGKLKFHGNFPGGNEQYLISLTNRSDHDLYLAELDITIPNASQDPRVFFDIDPSPSSRKPIGEATGDAAKYTDIIGGLCHDDVENVIFEMSVGHMAPHESRDFYLIHTAPGEAIASVESGFFTTDPQPISLNEHSSSQLFGFSKKVSGQCRMFNFLLDRNVKKGIHVLGTPITQQ
ncbi:hypothetical protein [Terracidiphilus gabretensis]|uniref:hypothetical protein n=1 Tax=Terracidiphilus gabretensis TaxID=1577687 RepID=UPI00071B31E8|nr:hypothetical protein [Terracidiphilus gabretensis]